MSDPIREAVETWLSKYSPTDDFGCACTPQRTCGTCQWRERTDELRKAIAAPVQGSVPEGWVMVPLAPTPGLLMSMAIRFDHALGIPGYYDQMLFGKKISEFTHEQRLAVTLGQMRQLHEEVVGTGFYAPEREAEYAAPRSTETGR